MLQRFGARPSRRNENKCVKQQVWLSERDGGERAPKTRTTIKTSNMIR